MKKFILAAIALAFIGWCAPASAQCVNVGGVNNVPQLGVNCNTEPSITTYAATGVGIVPAASATDVACIAGKAGTVLRLQRIRVSGTAGTLVNVPVSVNKNASRDTGGTPTTGLLLPVAYPVDISNAASGATLIAYSANPTIPDAAPGILDAGVVVLTASGTLAGNNGLVFDWTGNLFNQKPTLRAIAQQICVNFNSVSITTGLVNVSFLWTESSQ